MSRTPRGALPDGAFHLMTHAIDGGVLFRRDADRKRYLGLLQRVVERHHWKVFSLVLMDNHVHLLVDTTTKALSNGLWALHWPYAEYYKETYAPRFGPVFGGRPKTKPIRTDAYFMAVARYIALNPVGVLCDRSEQYRWSAHRAILGEAPPLPLLACDELLGRFGPVDALRQYREFVTGSNPTDHTVISRWAAGPPDDRPDLETVVAGRTPASYLIANELWGYSLRQIACVVGISHMSVKRAMDQERNDQRCYRGPGPL